MFVACLGFAVKQNKAKHNSLQLQNKLEKIARGSLPGHTGPTEQKMGSKYNRLKAKNAFREFASGTWLVCGLCIKHMESHVTQDFFGV